MTEEDTFNALKRKPISQVYDEWNSTNTVWYWKSFGQYIESCGWTLDEWADWIKQ